MTFHVLQCESVELHVHCEHQGHPDSVELPARITLSVSDRQLGSIVNPITVASRVDYCHLFMFKIHEKTKELCNEVQEHRWKRGCHHKDPLSFQLCCATFLYFCIMNEEEHLTRRSGSSNHQQQFKCQQVHKNKILRSDLCYQKASIVWDYWRLYWCFSYHFDLNILSLQIKNSPHSRSTVWNFFKSRKFMALIGSYPISILSS